MNLTDLFRTSALLCLCNIVSAYANDEKPLIAAGANVAVVPIKAGSVQGFIREGIFTFRGIPYASAERFMPPQPVKPWSGTRLTLSYGNVCPQFVNPQLVEPQTFIADTRYWPASEECQNLNIWSPGLQDGKRRPVMVWLHGGGFFSGSSMELPIYDGTNLSRKGDVVVVSINHRLNVLGFLDAPIYAIPAGKPPGKPVDRDNWGTFLSPAANHGSVDIHDPNPEPGGLEHFKLRIIHLTTPVSIAKTHYYWAMARNHGAPFDYEKTRQQADIVFVEDIAKEEASQSMAQRSIDQHDAAEFSVEADRAAVEARRRVAVLMAEEKRSKDLKRS